jgi:hypothetical protein
MIAPPRPPSHDDLEALIREARARQLRRRLLGAAGVAVAAAIGLSAYALTTGGAGRPAAASGPSGIGAPLCRSSQLSATGPSFVGATGSMIGGVTITNTSRSACFFPAGKPTVHVSRRGTPLPVHTRTTDPHVWPNWRPTRVLPPGDRSEVLLQWWNYCGPGAGRVISPTFELRLGRLVLRATADETKPPFCNAPGGASVLYVSSPLTPR